MAGAGCPCPDSLGGASKARRDVPGTAEAAQGTEFWQPSTQPYKDQGKPSSELQNRRNLIEVDTYTEKQESGLNLVLQRLSILLSIHSNTPEKDTQDLKE